MLRERIKSDIEQNKVIKTDGYNAYECVKGLRYKHEKKVVKGEKAHNVLKWVNILSSNAKAFLSGTYHGIDKKHLQVYLDKFCYRFNRRKWEYQLFDRLITACTNSSRIIYSELTN